MIRPTMSHVVKKEDLHELMQKYASHLEDELAKANERVDELEQEVKSGIFEAACFDLDVITCLTKIAYEHNADDIPRYREKAKRCAERISKRTSDLNKFALEQKIEVLESLLKNESSIFRLHNGTKRSGVFSIDIKHEIDVLQLRKEQEK